MNHVNSNETAAFVGSFLTITYQSYHGIDLDHVIQCIIYAAMGGTISIIMREGVEWIKSKFKK